MSVSKIRRAIRTRLTNR